MSLPARELLWDYALRTLGPEEQRALDRQLAQSPALRAELAELRELGAALADAAPAARPAAAVKRRLLASIAAPGPFAPWLEKLSLLLEVGVEQARALLARAADPSAWQPSGLEGMQIIPLAGGPGREEQASCLLRAPPGFCFPEHRHRGVERTLVFQGGFTDSLGPLSVRPGDVVVHAEGSRHRFVVDPGEECLAVTVVQGGLDFIGG